MSEVMTTGLDVMFIFKQKTAYEMRISDWSSDVCSSDLDSIELVTADKVEPAHELAEAFAKRAFGFALHPGQCADVAVHNLGEIFEKTILRLHDHAPPTSRRMVSRFDIPTLQAPCTQVCVAVIANSTPPRIITTSA